MKLAISTNTYHGFSLDTAIEGIIKTSIRNVELLAVKGWTEHVLPDMEKGKLIEIKENLKAKGINVVAVDGHANMITEAGMKSLYAGIELAHQFNAEWFVSELPQDCMPNSTKEYAQMIDRINELSEQCGKNGINIAFETRGTTYNTGTKIAKVIKESGSRHAYVNYDPANIMFFSDADPYVDLEYCMEYVGLVHLKDKIGGVGVWNFPALGSGEIDLPRILKMLGNTPVVSIDVEFTEKGVESVDIVHKALVESCEYIHSFGY